MTKKNTLTDATGTLEAGNAPETSEATTPATQLVTQVENETPLQPDPDNVPATEGVWGASCPPNRFPKGGSPLAAGGSPLESIDVLAARHRLPTWQQAALIRMTGWADGKTVTEEAFVSALASLSGRKLGNGRA